MERDGGELRREGQIVFMNELQTQLYYRDKVTLLTRKLSHQKALALATEPITVIKDFTELQSEEDPIMGYVIKYSFRSGIFGYLLLLISNTSLGESRLR